MRRVVRRMVFIDRALGSLIEVYGGPSRCLWLGFGRVGSQWVAVGWWSRSSRRVRLCGTCRTPIGHCIGRRERLRCAEARLASCLLCLLSGIWLALLGRVKPRHRLRLEDWGSGRVAWLSAVL